MDSKRWAGRLVKLWTLANVLASVVLIVAYALTRHSVRTPTMSMVWQEGGVPGCVVGSISDANGVPVRGACVSFDSDSGPVDLVSDQAGQFTGFVEPSITAVEVDGVGTVRRAFGWSAEKGLLFHMLLEPGQTPKLQTGGGAASGAEKGSVRAGEAREVQ